MADNDTIVLDEDGKEVNPKERNPFKRFIFTFINDDPKEIKKTILENYLIPGVIDLLKVTAHGAIEAVFDKDIRVLPTSSYGKGASSYRQAYEKQNNKNKTRVSSNIDKYSDLCNIPFDNRGKAEKALYLLRDTIKRTGRVDVGYFLDLAGEAHNFIDCEWGWTNLDMTYIRPARDGKCFINNIPYPTNFNTLEQKG